MRVLPGHDASKVKVTGPGVKPQGTVASMPTTFNIDTREAGIADTEVMIQVGIRRLNLTMVRTIY